MAAKTIMFPILLATPYVDEQQAGTAAVEHQQAEDQEIAGKPKEISPGIYLVPNTILQEILSRVPAKAVTCYKTVSKPWFSMLDCPIFSRTHFSRAPVCPLLVFSDKLGRNSTRTMHLVEGRTVSDLDPFIRKSKLSSRFDFSNFATSSRGIYDIAASDAGQFLPVNSNVVSCEGIVCWPSYHNCGGRIFLCNPITTEYFSLDPPPNEPETVYVFIGLGFVRRSKRFELLRMSLTGAKSKAEVSPWVSEVLTVGVGDQSYWRQVGAATFELDLSRRIAEVVYVNGAIYWRYDGDSSICSFDFSTHIFQFISVPQMNLMLENEYNFDSRTMSLGVLANSLCVSLVSRDYGPVSLWVLESPINVNQLVSWSKICDVESHTTCMDHSGMLGSRGRYKAMTYLDSGDILMHDWRETFLIYDPIEERETSFRALENSSPDQESRAYLQLQVVPHVPCLMKLKQALRME